MVSPKYDAKFRSRAVRKWCLRHCGVGTSWRLQYWRKVLDVYHVRAEILMKNHELSSTGFFLTCVHGDQTKAIVDGFRYDVKRWRVKSEVDGKMKVIKPVHLEI